MMIKDTIATDMVAARKEKDSFKTLVLGTLKGEIERKDDKSDTVIISLIKKMVDNALENNDLREAEILAVYLPQELTEEQLESEVVKLIESKGYSQKSDKGPIMTHFKNSFPGRYDGRILITIVERHLTV